MLDVFGDGGEGVVCYWSLGVGREVVGVPPLNSSAGTSACASAGASTACVIGTSTVCGASAGTSAGGASPRASSVKILSNPPICHQSPPL